MIIIVVENRPPHVKNPGYAPIHGMVDVVLEKGGNSNTNVQSHVSHHLTPSTKQPTWTRIVRPQSYEGMDTFGGQIQYQGWS